MRYSLFHVERQDTMSLQSQIREMLVSAMIAGQLPANSPVPSTRAMAKRLKVSRNTVMLAYQALAADGFLVARERSGFYVAPNVQVAPTHKSNLSLEKKLQTGSPVDWSDKFRIQPASQRNIVKPADWHDYKYPFIYGQVDQKLFPISAWRDCMRQTMSLKWLDAWTDDRFTADDPMLIEQIQQRVLTRRGVMAKSSEILITMGAQNALFLLTQLLVRPDTKVALEDPGYPDIRNMFELRTEHVQLVPVDKEGICVDQLGDAKIVFVTPSHQFPTNITMSLRRRRALLEWANENDALIIEDDYEYETNYQGEPTPALKHLDTTGRVLHVGSLSKSMMPGLRMGFVVAPTQVIEELRASRRLMLRHPPGNNQRVVALFLSLGGHDALINRLHRTYLKRWEALSMALAEHFPGWSSVPAFGGTSFWVEGPKGFDTRLLMEEAIKDSVLIEPGHIFFGNAEGNENYFRLGFSSIPEERIDEGIALLAQAVKRVMSKSPSEPLENHRTAQVAAE